MKTAGKVLGIIGGALGIVISLFMFFMSILFGTLINGIQNEYRDDFDSTAFYESANYTDVKFATPLDSTTVEPFPDNESLFADDLILPCVVFISSALGLVGGIIPNKKVGGILMIVGSVANITNFICFVLLLVGGILTLLPERKPYYPPYYPYQSQYYPPQPYNNQPPLYYPPQQYLGPQPQPYCQPPQDSQTQQRQPIQQPKEGTDKDGDINSSDDTSS